MKEWKEILKDEISAELTEQINIFETQIELKKLGKIDDKIFAETRLRKGVYGQRYDNGQRHDGQSPHSVTVREVKQYPARNARLARFSRCPEPRFAPGPGSRSALDEAAATCCNTGNSSRLSEAFAPRPH